MTIWRATARKGREQLLWANGAAFVGTFPRGDEMPGLPPEHCPVHPPGTSREAFMERLEGGGAGEAPESQRLSVVIVMSTNG